MTCYSFSLPRCQLAFLCWLIGAWHLNAALALDIDSAIKQHRQGTITIEAAPGTDVSVRQQRHEFGFGAALANQAFSERMPAEQRQKYLATFLTNFNCAVTENALKWHDMEPVRGQVNYGTVDAILAWTGQNGIPLRGHNIFLGYSRSGPTMAEVHVR